jgi:hypothetical protein
MEILKKLLMENRTARAIRAWQGFNRAGLPGQPTDCPSAAHFGAKSQ